MFVGLAINRDRNHRDDRPAISFNALCRMPSGPSSSDSLSFTRIGRLLRPLRSKCAQLAAAAKASSCTQSERAIYGRRPAYTGDDALNAPPPLSVLQNPRQLTGRAHLDRRNMRNLKPSQLIYGVVDAWSNVLRAAMPKDKRADANNTGSNIQSLAAICAAIIGEAVEEEVACRLEQDEEDEEWDADEIAEEEMAIMREYYEAVPAEHRCWTLVSHSLSIIHEACPHNPTLLSALLDLALSRCLVQESLHILHWLLVFAVRPARVTRLAPIEHPDHYAYLKDLCTRWLSVCTTPDSSSSSSTTPGVSTSPFTRRTFASELVYALQQYGTPSVWICPATICFARHLRLTDGAAYMELCAGIAEVAAELENSKLCNRLAWWLDRIPDTHYTDPDAYTAIVDALSTAHALGLHDQSRSSIPHLVTENLHRALLNAAARCVHAEAFMDSVPSQRSEILSLLRAGDPPSRPFDSLLSSIFPPPDSDIPHALPDILLSIQNMAATFDAHALLHLKKALWCCALRYAHKWQPASGLYDGAALHDFRRKVEEGKDMAVRDYRHAQVSNLLTSSDEEDNFYNAGSFTRPRATTLPSQLPSDEEAWDVGSSARVRVSVARIKARSATRTTHHLNNSSSDSDGEYRPTVVRGSRIRRRTTTPLGMTAGLSGSQRPSSIPASASVSVPAPHVTRTKLAYGAHTPRHCIATALHSSTTSPSAPSAPSRASRRGGSAGTSSTSSAPVSALFHYNSDASVTSESDDDDEELDQDWTGEDSASDWERARRVRRRPGRLRLAMPKTRPAPRVKGRCVNSPDSDEEDTGLGNGFGQAFVDGYTFQSLPGIESTI
ncbi:hypothetical protein K488DRAFT_81637 [Vararia minispora EC-137]|uniref:Uncharacterized protein n=1 Tax=Vararia minispora EC-137 TaxID=1314806 RepID=A0ACB8QYK4_9AGAM|nr:hypothetical protein K488DRAFT_81637 [Vararia minispora EC-137]